MVDAMPSINIIPKPDRLTISAFALLLAIFLTYSWSASHVYAAACAAQPVSVRADFTSITSNS